MTQSITATMQFGPATTHPGLAHWWASIETAIATAARQMFTSPAAGPTALTVHYSYLEQAAMAREMDRL